MYILRKGVGVVVSGVFRPARISRCPKPTAAVNQGVRMTCIRHTWGTLSFSSWLKKSLKGDPGRLPAAPPPVEG